VKAANRWLCFAAVFSMAMVALPFGVWVLGAGLEQS